MSRAGAIRLRLHAGRGCRITSGWHQQRRKDHGPCRCTAQDIEDLIRAEFSCRRKITVTDLADDGAHFRGPGD